MIDTDIFTNLRISEVPQEELSTVLARAHRLVRQDMLHQVVYRYARWGKPQMLMRVELLRGA